MARVIFVDNSCRVVGGPDCGRHAVAAAPPCDAYNVWRNFSDLRHLNIWPLRLMVLSNGGCVGKSCPQYDSCPHDRCG
jgi:hypothetical protein